MLNKTLLKCNGQARGGKKKISLKEIFVCTSEEFFSGWFVWWGFLANRSQWKGFQAKLFPGLYFQRDFC